MKNLIILGSALVITGLSSCTMSQQFSSKAAEDDVYWSRTSDVNKIQTLDDVNFDKQKDHKGGGNYYEPARTSENSNSTMSDEERANQAYQTWNAQRGNSSAQSVDQSTANQTQENILTEDEIRRFGTERSFYYTDPYFNSLANSWAWTSWYTPIVRPGYFAWAPGWNIGFGWGSRGGWNMGFGYNWGFGAFNYGNPYMYPSWGYDPWSPYYYPYYDPFAFNYGYGYHSWGYPYGYYQPWYGYNNCWSCNRWRNTCHTCWNRGTDIVQNTPRFIPRGEGIGRGASGSRPGSVNTGGQQSRPVNPAMGTAPAQVSGNLPARSGPNRNIRPDLNNAQNNPPAQSGIRPGGDLIQGPGGAPTYVPPRNRTSAPVTAAPDAGSTRPGGDLQRSPEGRTYYVPPRQTNYGGGSQSAAPEAPSNPAPNRSRVSFDPPAGRSSSPSYSPAPSASPSRSGGGNSGASSGGSRGSSGPISRPR